MLLPTSRCVQYTYEKEIVMYAYFKQLDYFSTGVYPPHRSACQVFPVTQPPHHRRLLVR